MLKAQCHEIFYLQYSSVCYALIAWEHFLKLKIGSALRSLPKSGELSVFKVDANPWKPLRQWEGGWCADSVEEKCNHSIENQRMKNKQVFEHHNLCAKKEHCGCKPPLQFWTMAVALKNATPITKSSVNLYIKR